MGCSILSPCLGSGEPYMHPGAELSPGGHIMPLPCRCGKGMAQSQGFFPFFQLQPGLAVQFSAHQQPPTSLPCSAAVSFLMHLFPQVQRSTERWGTRLASPQSHSAVSHTHTGRREKEPLRKSRYPEGKEVTPNFFTSSSSLLSTLLTAMFSYCSMSRATCKPQGQTGGQRDSPAPAGRQQSCSVPCVTFSTG